MSHDTTVPGGRYRTADGRLVNAHGEPLEAASVASEGQTATLIVQESGKLPREETVAVGLPEDFPHRDALQAAGYHTLEIVKNATDAELRAVPTIGPAAIRAIRARQ
ncbi:MAG: hypothetical protein H0X64_13530 [Gemmatimonadaceae bacterium]|nr:hypothetical protein [Gemmatimonadaceae bacterium]